MQTKAPHSFYQHRMPMVPFATSTVPGEQATNLHSFFADQPTDYSTAEDDWWIDSVVGDIGNYPL